MSATTLEELSDSVCAGEKWTLRLELLGWLEKLGGVDVDQIGDEVEVKEIMSREKKNPIPVSSLRSRVFLRTGRSSRRV